MTAEDRAAERGANRQVLVAALAGRPARHERECLAVFAKDGFQLLVDLAESVVVTVFPQGAVIAAIKRRDSGVWAHREGRRTRNTRYAQRRKRRR